LQELKRFLKRVKKRPIFVAENGALAQPLQSQALDASFAGMPCG
jgi:hypothetical protein